MYVHSVCVGYCVLCGYIHMLLCKDAMTRKGSLAHPHMCLDQSISDQYIYIFSKCVPLDGFKTTMYIVKGTSSKCAFCMYYAGAELEY